MGRHRGETAEPTAEAVQGGCQHIQIHRFGQIGIGAHRQSMDTIGRTATAGQHDDADR